MSNLDPKIITWEIQRERNAFWISLITGILLIIISAVSIFATIQTGMNSFSGIFVTLIVSISAFASVFLSSKHRSNQGILILISTILLLSLSLPFIAKGQGLAMGIMVAIIISGISSATLDSKWNIRATLAGILVGVLITLVDLFTPIGYGTPTDPRITLAIATILTVIYAIYIATRYSNFNLRTKLILAFIAVSVIPLAGLGYQNYQNISVLLNAETNKSLLNTASLISDSLDGFIKNQLDSIRTEALIVDFADLLNTPASERKGKIVELRVIKTLQALQLKDPIYILAYSLLDEKGIEVADTFASDIGTDKSDQDYFSGALAGVPFVSSIRISQSTREPNLYFSAPIRNERGAIIGVLCARYSASLLQEMLNNSLKSNQSEQYAVLVDNQFQVLLAHTNNPGLNYKSYGNLTPAQAKTLQIDGRLAPGIFSDVVYPMPDSIAAINNVDQSPIFTIPASVFDVADSISAGIRLKTHPNWIITVRQSVNSALTPINNQSRASILLALLMASLAIGAALVVAQVLSAPIAALTSAAEKISAGDLTAQAEIKTQDEIGILAKTFNTMTNQIRQTLEGLELRVQERTVDLEKAREQTEKRAHALEAISEVSRIIAIEQNLDRLLPLITRMISERFNYYHVGIFLLDDSQTFAILRAANSPGGQRMLARGHKLEVGLTGLVGFVAQKGTPRIALDVGDDAVYFNNPDLPETRSEIALPLNLREHTIGVLDVQSITPASFTEADANTLTILAEQVAIAIDNARLFSETQRALSESQALYRQFVSQAWDNQPGRTNPIGYIQTATGGKQVDKAFKTPEISQAMANGEIVVSASENNEQNNNRKAITVPIKLHNQVIGVLNVRSGENDHNWNEDEIGIMQAVSERIAYALDNARLLGDLQRRAARERSIGQISARIGEANNIDAILRSTVEELGKKLRNTEVVIQITDQNNKRDNSQE